MAIKILSVDDELDLEILLTQYFRRKIKKGEYEFTFVHNGLEALQAILSNPDFDIILSDINMPEMDGLTLLTKINELRNPAMKCIMVSAYGDMENIRTAMNRGAFDFTTKPINLEDLERTIEKAVEQIYFIKNAQNEHLQLKSIQSDLKIAREIQETILPKDFNPFPNENTFNIYAIMNAAKYVGGDFYDFFKIDNDRLGFVIADVSGKGVPAAIFMAISRTIIRAIAQTDNSAAICMNRANDMLCKENVNDMFVTVFYGILNIQTGLITYCNAGHNPPIVIKHDNTVSFAPLTGDRILGAMADSVYHEKEIQLVPGDTLFLYTDGVTEAKSKNNDFYGEQQLLQNCLGLTGLSSKEIVNRITETVDEFAPGAVQSDDITLLSITYKGNQNIPS